MRSLKCLLFKEEQQKLITDFTARCKFKWGKNNIWHCKRTIVNQMALYNSKLPVIISKNNHLTDMFGFKSQVLVNLKNNIEIPNELRILKAPNYVRNVIQKYVIYKGFATKRYFYLLPSTLPRSSF